MPSLKPFRYIFHPTILFWGYLPSSNFGGQTFFTTPRHWGTCCTIKKATREPWALERISPSTWRISFERRKSLGFFFVWQIFWEGFLGSWGSLHDQIELSWKMMEKHQTNIESSGSNSHGNWVFVDVLATKSCSRKHPPTSTVTFSLSLAERRARVTLPSLGHWALTAAGVTLFSDINPPKQCTLCFGEMPANDHTCFIKFDPPKWVPFNDFNDPGWLTLVVSLHHKRLLAGCHQDGGRPEILLFAAQIYNVLFYYLKGSTSNWVATVPPTNSKNWHDVSQDFQNNMQCIRFRFFIWTYATSSKKQARKLSNCAVDPQIPSPWKLTCPLKRGPFQKEKMSSSNQFWGHLDIFGGSMFLPSKKLCWGACFCLYLQHHVIPWIWDEIFVEAKITGVSPISWSCVWYGSIYRCLYRKNWWMMGATQLHTHRNAS